MSSGGHGIPQPPQFSGSPDVSVQPVGQHVCEPLQVGPPLQPIVDLHLPPLQMSPMAHGMPQPPQLFGSVLVSTHLSVQQVSEIGHGMVHPVAGWHLLATHVSVAAQAMPQPPQLVGSLVVSVQPALQHASEPLHGGPPLHMKID